MGFMDMFKQGSQQQQQPQGQQQNQNQGQQMPNGQTMQQQGQQAGSQGPGAMPGQNSQGGGQGNNDPLAAYSKLWDNSSNGNPSAPPSFVLDPKVLKEASGSIKFTEGLDPELMQRATSGDMNAFMEVINAVAQNTYRTSLEHGSTLTDRFVGARSQYDSKQFAPQVKNQLVTQELSSIPNYSHPAVRKQVDMVAEGMQRQNPDASPAEVAKMVKDYFQAVMMATGMAPQNSGANNGQGQGASATPSTDWAEWLKDSN